VQDELPAVDDPELDYTKDSQDPISSQDPYKEAIKLLAATGDGELERSDSTDGRPREHSDFMSAPRRRMNDGLDLLN
jgi:hypothetical protein